jgi:hypothetical protein
VWMGSRVNELSRPDDYRSSPWHFQRPSRPRDVAHPRYSLVFKVGPGGLDNGWSPPRTPAGGIHYGPS